MPWTRTGPGPPCSRAIVSHLSPLNITATYSSLFHRTKTRTKRTSTKQPQRMSASETSGKAPKHPSTLSKPVLSEHGFCLEAEQHNRMLKITTTVESEVRRDEGRDQGNMVKVTSVTTFNQRPMFQSFEENILKRRLQICILIGAKRVLLSRKGDKERPRGDLKMHCSTFSSHWWAKGNGLKSESKARSVRGSEAAPCMESLDASQVSMPDRSIFPA